MKKENKKLEDFKLLHDNVLVQTIERPNKGKLADVSQYEDKPEYGIVVSVGTGRIDTEGEIIELQVKVGDIIFFGKYSSIQTRDDGKDYYIIKEYDIMAYA
jgi:chaperonin GroES